MSFESSLLEPAIAAYQEARFRSDLPAATRVNAARRFRAVVAGLDETRGALSSFVAALSSEDVHRRNAAARALVETQWPEATEQLLRAYATQGPQLDGIVARQLGKRAPLPDDAWGLLERVRDFERGALVAALFRRPSAIAEQRWHEVIAGDDDVVAYRAIDAIARWGRPELLRALLPEPRRSIPPGLPPELRSGDIRLPAAFQLALRGDPGGIAFLLEEAAAHDAEQAVAASLYLATLGLPAAVAPVARQLRGHSTHALGLALDAAERLRTPTLGPALCVLAERATARGFPSMPDAALRALATITGCHSMDPAGDDGSATPLATRTWAASVQRTVLAELDGRLRYHAGEPLTLAHMVSDLTSIHHGSVSHAAYALQAITGEDVGFDPDDDLIANLDALEAWHARLNQPAPVGPGEWAFHGRPLPPPEMPA